MGNIKKIAQKTKKNEQFLLFFNFFVYFCMRINQTTYFLKVLPQKSILTLQKQSKRELQNEGRELLT